MLNIQNFKTNATSDSQRSLISNFKINAGQYYIVNGSGIFLFAHLRLMDFVPFQPIGVDFFLGLHKYLWTDRLSRKYLPCCFTALNFSKTKSLIFHVKPSKLLSVLSFFKNSWFFNYSALLDLWATDFPARQNRFEITYSLLSTKKNERVYFRSFLGEWGVMPSATLLFNSANWLEREVWDLFGVPFGGHTDLRRILTDYGFLGHPLRKDFPLTGFFEVRYDDTSRRIVSESLNLVQELRLFFFLTPWKQI